MLKTALVNMPFSFLHNPMTGLGILSSQLKSHGFECDILEIAYEFAEQVGFKDYDTFANQDAPTFLSNWCFARKAFPGPNREMNEEIILESGGHDISVMSLLDMRKQCEQFIDSMVSRFVEYDIVGFSTWSNQITAGFAMGRAIKAVFPDKTIVYGGPGVQGEAGIEYLRSIHWADYVFLGEADKSFVTLVDGLSKGVRPHVDNAVYKNSVLIESNESQDIVDLNSVPVPDYEQFIDKQSQHPDNRFDGLCLEFSRGCYYGIKKCCTFCADVEISKNQYKPRTPQNALEYLMEAHERYPDCDKFYIVDSILPPNFARNIFLPWSQIRPRRSSFWLMAKPWLSRQDMSILSNAGVDRIYFGIESLHSGMLNLLRKGQTVAQSIACIKWAHYYKMDLEWNLLVQIPGAKAEWYHEMVKTLRKIKHLACPYVYTVDLTKRSPYWHERHKRGFQNVRPHSMYRNILPDHIDVDAVAFKFIYSSSEVSEDISIYDELFEYVDEWRGSSCFLELTNDGVLDTRYGYTTHEISDVERNIIVYCDAPRNKTHISHRFGDISQEIQRLEELNIIVVADDQVVSLAHTSEDFRLSLQVLS